MAHPTSPSHRTHSLSASWENILWPRSLPRRDRGRLPLVIDDNGVRNKDRLARHRSIVHVFIRDHAEVGR